MVRRVGEQLNGGRGFSLHHLFARVSRRAASAARVCGLVWLPPGEPLDVVVLVRAWGGSWRPGCCSWRWHQFRVASSKFLHSSRTLFLLFCQPCLVRDFSAAQTCLRVPTATLSSCAAPRSQSQSDLGIKKLPYYFCEHPDLKLRALLTCDLTLGDHKICVACVLLAAEVRRYHAIHSLLFPARLSPMYWRPSRSQRCSWSPSPVP